MVLKRWIALALALSVLTGCATVRESRLNPFNWFGSDEETVAPVDVVNERRPLVSQITSLEIERTPGGAIVRSTALPPTQGWFAAELVPVSSGGAPVDGVLSYAFRAVPPETPVRQSTPQSRELTAGTFIPNIVLNQVRVIQVTGSQNSRIARR